MPGHRSLLCSGEFTLRAAALQDSTGPLSDGRVDPGGMETVHQGRETDREGKLFDRRAEWSRQARGSVQTSITSSRQRRRFTKNPLPSLTSQFCRKPGVNKRKQSNRSAVGKKTPKN